MYCMHSNILDKNKLKADLDYRARLAYVMTFDHPHAHNIHKCRTNVVGLIYTTRSVVKSWSILVARDSPKQKS